jgi:hypothetical protein
MVVVKSNKAILHRSSAAINQDLWTRRVKKDGIIRYDSAYCLRCRNSQIMQSHLEDVS